MASVHLFDNALSRVSVHAADREPVETVLTIIAEISLLRL